MVRIPQRKVTNCNTYNHSFFFIVVLLQFSIKFYFSGWMVLITNCKLVISVRKRRKISRSIWFLIGEPFPHKKIFFIWSLYLDENHSLLDNPPFSPTVDLDNQKKEILPYPRCGFGACLRCERVS